MVNAEAGSSLSQTHPLIAELASLRQQLVQYQKAAHQSASQLQASRREILSLQESNRYLKGKASALTAEVEELRYVRLFSL